MKYKIESKKSIERWDEAIPSGNGLTGCLTYGTPKKLIFSLDRADIWDRRSVIASVVNSDSAEGMPSANQEHSGCRTEFTYGNMVRLAGEGRMDEIDRIFDEPYNHPLPSKLPLGRIVLSFPEYENVDSALDLETAYAELVLSGKASAENASAGKDNAGKDNAEKASAETVSAEKVSAGKNSAEKASAGNNCQEVHISTYVHALRDIGVISVSLSPDEFGIRLENPDFGNGKLETVNYDKAVIKRLETGSESYIDFFVQKTDSMHAYGIVMGIRKSGTGSDNKDDSQTLILYKSFSISRTEQNDNIKDSFYPGKEISEIRKLLHSEKANMPDVGKGMLQSHIAWWKNYWSESSINIPDKELGKSWYVNNYLFACCSNEKGFPMPLQGVFTADDGGLPPWKGDYHNDLNTQMSYGSFLKANHIRAGSVFTSYLWKMRDAGKKFAKDFYNTEGICMPAVMTIEGKALGGWPMYSLSPSGQMWLCQSFADYYEYTGDEAFLRKRCYPYLKASAECIIGLLEKNADGYLELPISSSPEIHDDTIQAFLTPNSNYDLALMKNLFDKLEKYANMLGKREAKRWHDIGLMLPPLAVNENMVLMLSPDESLEESHRHFSHLHAVYPLRLIKYDTDQNKKIIDDSIHNLEQLGTSQWVGFSFCWMAQLYAIAGRGDDAYRMLEIFMRAFCSTNGFHLNGDYKNLGYSDFKYRPFTLEANMCAAGALQEMLCYMEDDELRLFPAIPLEWNDKRVEFSGFRLKHGILAAAVLEKGRLTKCILKSEREINIIIKGYDRNGRHDENAQFRIYLHIGDNIYI